VWLKELTNAAIDLIFPPFCVACHRFGAWLCSDCVDEIETIRPPVCSRCGMPLDGPVRVEPIPSGLQGPGCVHCQSTPRQLDSLLACAIHSGPLREAIRQFKYEDLRALAAPLGQLMADGWRSLSAYEGDLTIVPVPLHPARQRERGYNQAALLARELGRQLQRPVVEDTLVRVKATVPQVGLGVHERRANVRDAFRCVNGALANRQVLLVDDVCTTGSTLEAASTALRNGGAVSVWAYTLARARVQTNPVLDESY
jgi:ComF family protein